MTEERRKGKDRRAASERRHAIKKIWFMSIGLVEKRGPLDRRAGLDRRQDFRGQYRREAIIEVKHRGIIKSWDCSKAKMTYLWDSGLEAITFAPFQKGKAVEVVVHTHQGRLAIAGYVLRVQKLFTDHGFATQMDVQFNGIDDHKRAVIHQMLWGD